MGRNPKAIPLSIRDSYTRWSLTYDHDRNWTRDLDREVTRQVLGGRSFSTALETGCGTGKNTPFLAQIAARVTALDFSPGMLAQARRKVRAGNVDFAVADLTRRWPCASQWAGLVACNLVLEHIQDLAFIFAEAERALTPGGSFFVSELHPFRQYQGIQANFQQAGETVAIPAYVHHLSDFLSAAGGCGLALRDLQEWWHAEDRGKPPRLVTLMFAKAG